MKHSILLLVILLFFGCKLTEEQNNSSEVIKSNGVYVAENTEAAVGNSRGIDSSLKAVTILRLYNNGTGVIVPLSIKKALNSYNDSMVRVFINWTTEFERKNPQDKSFVHFKYIVVDDSIRFLQTTPEVIFQYNGKAYTDSIDLSLQYLPNEMKFTPNPPKHLFYKFYAVDGL